MERTTSTAVADVYAEQEAQDNVRQKDTLPFLT